jgi:Tol biopolymer transport system component
MSCASSVSQRSSSSDVLALLSTPDTIPQVFAKGIISTPVRREGAIAFAPDMHQIYFTTSDSTGVAIMEMSYVDEKWQQPKLWAHSNMATSSEAFVTPDGKHLYFISNRHAPDAKGSGRIWRSAKVNGAWSSPKMLEWNPNTDKGIWFPSVSDKGTIFFGAYLDSIGNYGKSDLYMYSSGKITNLGDVINSPGEEWDPYISPDESYLLFESDRPGGYGNTDIYISFKTKEGWGKPINLGSTINTNAYEVAARVSPDGRYIFFDRPFKKEQDIHWMKATVIERLKKKQVR